MVASDGFTFTFDSQVDSPDVLTFGSLAQKKETDDWHGTHQEGQLAVDVFEMGNDIVVISTMAGAVTEKIHIDLHKDLLTIRGERRAPFVPTRHETLFHQECFWGVFSRTVVLPVEVIADRANAEYRNGILTIRIPKKQHRDRKIPITIVDA